MELEGDASQPKQRQRSFAVRGELLRSLRQARGWTQREAARRADISERLIRKAESGDPIEAKSIVALASLYASPENQITPEQLLVDPQAFSAEPPPSSSISEKLRRWFDGQWNNLNLDVIDELATPDFEFDMEAGVVRGIAEMKQRVLKFRESFGEFDFIVEEVWDLGDAVAVRWRVWMTQIGPWVDLPATQRRVLVRGSSWAQLRDGKFARAWDFWNPSLLYRELQD